MMATAEPPNNSGFLPLLESLEDRAAGQSEQTDAYLTIANRLSGEEGRQFLPAVEKHFPRLGKIILAHITSSNVELSQAALQALGFCVYHSNVVSGESETLAEEILSALCSLVKSTDKNTCTRALWVISKQNFPPLVVATKVPSVLSVLESVWSREDIQSVVMEYEALNVIIRMLEQVPTQMGDGAVRWAKLIFPLVVHSAPKVRLRAAVALEMGMPLLLEKQNEVVAIIEPMMSSKLIPEMQKLFMTKNETNVLKLWPLFVRLLGKLLHKGGPFINSLLHLEELGFRSSSPAIKKIAFIAWKSLIDNFALNPDILCSSKRMKLLMQPLSSINVKTEALLLTKVEVWWYMVVQLGPNLSSNFDMVSVPLLQCTIGSDSPSVPGTPSRAIPQNGGLSPCIPKTGFSSPVATSRINLNSSVNAASTFPSIQLLGIEMLLHYFLGPEILVSVAKNKLILSLEPLKHPFLSSASSFTKHAAVLISSVRDGFIGIGKEAPEPLLTLIWTSLVRFIHLSIEAVGSKKDRQGCEVLTLMLQALQSIVMSEALPSKRVLFLFEATVKGIPQKILGSASYQVGKMDVMKGTPALFLIFLLYDSSMLTAYIEDDRFFHCLQALVNCGLSGPTSPLAFGEAVLGAIRRSAGTIQNKELLWKMWSLVVSSLTETITQSNEVNQGDALEHNFSSMHTALMFPVTHLLHDTSLQQASQKSMLSTWSKLYKVFARCSALVVTVEENICCEELCTKMVAALNKEALMVPSTLNSISSILQVMAENADFSPYTPHFQKKLKSPHTPGNWMKKKNKALGNLFTFHSLVVQCLDVYLDKCEASSEATGTALVSILSTLFTNLVVANAVQELFTALIQPLTLLYKHADSEPARFTSQFVRKLEKLLSDVLGCLQTRTTLTYDSELLDLLSPLLCVLFSHKNKHLRTTVTQFWNATFANSVNLSYPEDLRPILTRVKQKTPIILPGFEVVSVPDELSGQDSAENSQLETKLSGIPFSSMGKRDSLLGKTPEMKDRCSSKISKLVSMKLDFGSPKPPRREVLEEEASIDFVFIPPEAKERVLTEHQKEVKRTKRVDIPAMYNNLDASLDTTVFTQYTQSQEDSMGKGPTEEADEASSKVSGSEVTNGNTEVKTQDFASPKAEQEAQSLSENDKQEDVIPESADVSMEESAQSEDAVKDSPNASSDMLSGTPQKPGSRRQSFITLEKYAEGKPPSPSSAPVFTGPLVKTRNRQKTSTPSHSTDSPNAQDSSSSQTEKTNQHLDNTPESPRLPKEERKIKGVKLTDRLPSDTTEEDMIPDTQTETDVKAKANPEEINPSSQEEESDQTLEASLSPITSPSEPRRSGRHRIRPLLPGEDPEERDGKYTKLKRKRPAEDNSDSQKSNAVQVRPNTRSKLTTEEDSAKDRLRTRAQKSELSQTNKKKVKLYNNSQDFLEADNRRRSSRESSQINLQSDSQSDHESHLQGRRGSKGKSTREEEVGTKKKDPTDKIEPSPNATTDSLEIEMDEEPRKEDEKHLHSDNLLQQQVIEEAKSVEKDINQEESPIVSLDLDHCDSEMKTKTTEPQKAKLEMTEDLDVDLSQEESQSITRSSSDTQTRGRLRRSQSLSEEPAETKDMTENKGPKGRQTRSGSQVEAKTSGRTRRNMVQEDHSQSSSTPDHSQSLDTAESSQGRGRRSTRRSSVVETKESVTLEKTQSSPMLKIKGKKHKVLSLLSPLTFETKDEKSGDTDSPKAGLDVPPTDDSQSVEMKYSEASQKNKESESLDEKANNDTSEEQTQIQVDNKANVEDPDPDLTNGKQPLSESPSKTRKQQIDSEVELCSPQQSDVGESVENPSSTEMREQIEDKATESSHVETLSTSEKHEQVFESSGDTKETAEPGDVAKEEQSAPSDEKAGDAPNENGVQNCCTASDPVQTLCDTADDALKEEEQTTGRSQDQPAEHSEGITPLQENYEDDAQVMESQSEEKTEDHVEAHSEAPHMTEMADAADEACVSTAPSSDFPDSPVKQRDLEAIMGPDAGQSPSSQTKGAWSPLASPSTSILKKGQKRLLEVETPSPLVKSRRVSFANPIQQQEVADDIDRRSPAVRTSSPKRAKISAIPQPTFVTTPTKGFISLSPRNLLSSGSKSSKKCLISEMGQVPRPVSKDCIFPALVGCTAPVEAVLPQISSTMWSRGFGQLVRAQNIKTVGDLSALTPAELKVLPIRSPKAASVKKALKAYKQQRKGRGVDELKSFDETELLTAEVEDAPQTQEEMKTLATELGDKDKPVPVEENQNYFYLSPRGNSLKIDQDHSEIQPTDTTAGPQTTEDQPQCNRLLSKFEDLNSRITSKELSHCLPQQLVQIHHQLGDMMKRVMDEMHSRFCETNQS